jgi:hypothetical protein
MLFGSLNLCPLPSARTALTFTVVRFAEQVTIFAHQAARRAIPRESSLINQIWRYHAIDEARHVAFDALVIGRHSLLPIGWLAAPLAASISFLIHKNELWAASQLGLDVPLWKLPMLVRRTEAPFKRRVFRLMTDTMKQRPVTEESEA